MDQAPALLLIAHGTRDPRGSEEMRVLVRHVRDVLRVPVGHGWIEDFANPSVGEAMHALADAGADTVVTLPLLNFAAGHAKTDVPGEVDALRRSFPAVSFHHGRVLGHHPALFTLACQRLDGVTPREQRVGEALLVAASGSSDPDANGDLAKAARILAEHSGHRWVEHGFAGVTWPRVQDVVTRMARAGAQRIALFSWSLLAGRLHERVRRAAAETSADLGVPLVDAGRFGPDRLVAAAVADRYHEAVAGPVHANCDVCCYRVPLPGLENRVGAPSPGGTA